MLDAFEHLRERPELRCVDVGDYPALAPPASPVEHRIAVCCRGREWLVGAGSGPSLVLAVGARGKRGLNYPVDDAAIRHGAGVGEETTEPTKAYAGLSRLQPGPPPEL